MRTKCASFIVLVLLASTLAVAQEMSHPPKVLEIIREEVKTGKTAAHDKHEAAWLHAMLANHYNSYGLTISSVTGPSEEWFLIGHDSFADWEKGGEAMMKNAALRDIMTSYGEKDADYISESSTLLARYRPELSYKPDFNVGEYKYFSVAIVRARMGSDGAEPFKILNAAREKASLDEHHVVFQVSSGMPAGTYLSFTPVKSMAAWDEPSNEAYQAALKEAKFSEAVGKDIMNVNFRLFAFNPELSHVPADVTKADPEFWHPKAEMTKAKSSQPAAKSATPAAKKSAEPKK